MPWGDANATWRLRLVDGRDLIARRFAAGTGADARRVAANMTVVARAGIPVPDPRIIEIDGTPWLITNHVEGAVGAAWLDTGARARTVAAGHGRLRRQLIEIDRSAGAGRERSGAIDRPPRNSPASDALDIAETVLEPATARHGLRPWRLCPDQRHRRWRRRRQRTPRLRARAPWRSSRGRGLVVLGGSPSPSRRVARRMADLLRRRRRRPGSGRRDHPGAHGHGARPASRGAKDVHDRDRWLARLVEAAAWRP